MQRKQLFLIIFLLLSFLFSLFFFLRKNLFAIDNCNDGWQVNTNGQKTIHCHQICRTIKNNCSVPVFIPTRTSTEWQQFLAGAPQCIYIENCNFTLSVSKSGSGYGTVTSNPNGIYCGSTCSASFETNSQVTLTASPSSGSVFGGWSGDCSGTNTTCTLTMNSNKSVGAIFNTSSGTPIPTETPIPDDCCNYCPCGCVTRDIGTCTEFAWCWNSTILKWEPCCKHYRINFSKHDLCELIGGQPRCYSVCATRIIYVSTSEGGCVSNCPSPSDEFCAKTKQLGLIFKKNLWLQR